MYTPAQLDALGYTPFNFPFLSGGAWDFKPDGYVIVEAGATQRISIIGLSVSVNGADIVWQISEDGVGDLIGPVYQDADDPAYVLQGSIYSPVTRGNKGNDILFTSSGVTNAVTVSGWALKEGLSA